ncbi:hypothetical protein QJQ45_023832 [Haematococcus lacustris]|nr:hypothetical protein QJQ45_023832 [Haematococcus lacustris]
MGSSYAEDSHTPKASPRGVVCCSCLTSSTKEKMQPNAEVQMQPKLCEYGAPWMYDACQPGTDSSRSSMECWHQDDLNQAELSDAFDALLPASLLASPACSPYPPTPPVLDTMASVSWDASPGSSPSPLETTQEPDWSSLLHPTPCPSALLLTPLPPPSYPCSHASSHVTHQPTGRGRHLLAPGEAADHVLPLEACLCSSSPLPQSKFPPTRPCIPLAPLGPSSAAAAPTGHPSSVTTAAMDTQALAEVGQQPACQTPALLAPPLPRRTPPLHPDCSFTHLYNAPLAGCQPVCEMPSAAASAAPPTLNALIQIPSGMSFPVPQGWGVPVLPLPLGMVWGIPMSAAAVAPGITPPIFPEPSMPVLPMHMSSMLQPPRALVSDLAGANPGTPPLPLASTMSWAAPCSGAPSGVGAGAGAGAGFLTGLPGGLLPSFPLCYPGAGNVAPALPALPLHMLATVCSSGCSQAGVRDPELSELHDSHAWLASDWRKGELAMSASVRDLLMLDMEDMGLEGCKQGEQEVPQLPRSESGLLLSCLEDLIYDADMGEYKLSA